MKSSISDFFNKSVIDEIILDLALKKQKAQLLPHKQLGL